ncbi:MAG: T9SS type A sorting domain-containing protein [Bacteroidia bacterium]|nr:T9SS type A sorting domain-containing protein [Bacteroidia bacterium]
MELILHGVSEFDTDYFNYYNNGYNYYLNLLTSAPDCGPHKNGDFTSNCYSYHWSSSNRLVYPENLGIGKGTYGYYNGLDYMLLHNLFWLVYLDKQPLNYYLINGTIPYCSTCAGSHFSPGIYNSSNKIFSSQHITSDGDITYNGRNSVKLLPGFKVDQGANFRAKIVGEDLGTPLIYEKTNYTPTCPCYPSSRYINPDIANVKSNKDSLLTLNEEIITPYFIYNKPIKEQKEQLNINGKEVINSKQGSTLLNSKESNQAVETIKIFPNPNNGDFYVNVFSEYSIEGNIYVQNMLGAVIFDAVIKSNIPIHINLKNFAKSVYTINIKLPSKTYVNKVVIQ